MRHGEGLGKRMERAAPGDLPGRNVRNDKADLEQQLINLSERDSRDEIIHQEGFT